MKEQWLLGISLGLYVLGAAALTGELFNSTPVSADSVPAVTEQSNQIQKGLTNISKALRE